MRYSRLSRRNSLYEVARRAAELLVLVAAQAASAGEIPGLMPPSPPHHEQDFGLVFSNDFLGRGGSVDDFRTQQIILSASLSGRWTALLDHSILTLSNGVDAGRIDQLAVSFGYDAINRYLHDRTDNVAIGFGVRGEGSFAGERIQNRFHRLIGSTIEDLPYASADGTEATAWLDASHYRLLSDVDVSGFLPGWRKGAWFRAGSLVTTGGQWDSTVSAHAVASRGSIDVWLGVRSDWRQGYEKAVLTETAHAEDDVAVVLGVRFGALVVETVQQLNNDASHGQLRLISTNRRNRSGERYRPRVAIGFGISMPDVTVRLAGKFPVRLSRLGSPDWDKSVLAVATYGEPQYKNDNQSYVRNEQLEVGLEFERPWAADSDWLSVFAATTAGWREQALILPGELRDERTDKAGRAVLTVGGGARVAVAGPGHGWQLRIQACLFATLPLADANLEVNGETYRVQQATLNALLGFTVEFE
jgi:hypothetical protein